MLMDDAQYEYANELLQAVGFSSLADYTTLVKCSDIDGTVLDRVNETIPRFRKLFRQRDYNLSRYGYRLQKSEHLLGLLKKMTTQLGIGYEICRYKGANHLRLKPPTNHLERFIKKMQDVTTGSHLTKQTLTSTGNTSPGGLGLGLGLKSGSKTELKSKRMSEILKEYGNTDKRTKEYYFFDKLTAQRVRDIADVIMNVTSKAPFNVTIAGHSVVENVTEWKPVLPMFALLYHEVTITLVKPGFNSITVHSVGLNRLRFDITNWRIVLDSPDKGETGPYPECMNGGYVPVPKTVIPIPVVQSSTRSDTKDHLLNVDEVEIMGYSYKIGKSDYVADGLNEKDALAIGISRLATHKDTVDGIYGEYEKELELEYCEMNGEGDTVTAYYVLPRDYDVLMDIQPVTRNRDSTYSFQILNRKCEVPESGLHHPFPVVSACCVSMYYVVSGIPVNMITSKLPVKATFIFLDADPRKELAHSITISDMENGVVEGPDLAKYFAK